MQLNTQPRERRTLNDDGYLLEIVNVWDTMQGEGPYAGTPAMFVRLAGCNLQCGFCDTDYTTDRKRLHINEIVNQIEATRPPPHLVVITGGEPFRQNIGPFVSLLRREGYLVQIETNGTLFRPEINDHLYRNMVIVCSPKAPNVHHNLQEHVTALKYVLSADSVNPHDGLPARVLGSRYSIARPWPTFNGSIYVQPEDHQDLVRNKANVDAAVASCMKFGYRLCLQLHKIVGLE
jgi:organic radical activating enzyme